MPWLYGFVLRTARLALGEAKKKSQIIASGSAQLALKNINRAYTFLIFTKTKLICTNKWRLYTILKEMQGIRKR